jgi:hypothetical protein
MSDKKKKTKVSDQGEIIKLTNGMIDGFLNNPSITKLRQLKGLRAELRYKIFKLWETIVASPEAKALSDTKNELVKEHEESQAKLKPEQRVPLTLENPKVQELFAIGSGLEVKKIIIPSDQLTGEFTPFDMNATAWLIEFVEKG